MMKTSLSSVVRMTVAGVLWLTVAGCDSSSTEKQAPGVANAPKVLLPENLFVSDELPGGKDVGVVKQDQNLSGEVVLRGRIGGRVDPFVKGRAIFTLADRRMATCDEAHGDGCKTPWDYCCESKEDLLANTATIQVVGPDGQPLAVDLEGHHGLRPQARLLVAGKIVQRGNGVLVINADRICVEQGKP